MIFRLLVLKIVLEIQSLKEHENSLTTLFLVKGIL